MAVADDMSGEAGCGIILRHAEPLLTFVSTSAAIGWSSPGCRWLA